MKVDRLMFFLFLGLLLSPFLVNALWDDIYQADAESYYSRGNFFPERMYKVIQNEYFVFFSLLMCLWSFFYVTVNWGLKKSGRVPEGIERKLSIIISLLMTLPLLWGARKYARVEDAVAAILGGWVGLLLILGVGMLTFFVFYNLAYGFVNSEGES